MVLFSALQSKVTSYTGFFFHHSTRAECFFILFAIWEKVFVDSGPIPPNRKYKMLFFSKKEKLFLCAMSYKFRIIHSTKCMYDIKVLWRSQNKRNQSAGVVELSWFETICSVKETGKKWSALTLLCWRNISCAWMFHWDHEKHENSEAERQMTHNEFIWMSRRERKRKIYFL